MPVTRLVTTAIAETQWSTTVPTSLLGNVEATFSRFIVGGRTPSMIPSVAGLELAPIDSLIAVVAFLARQYPTISTVLREERNASIRIPVAFLQAQCTVRNRDEGVTLFANGVDLNVWREGTRHGTQATTSAASKPVNGRHLLILGPNRRKKPAEKSGLPLSIPSALTDVMLGDHLLVLRRASSATKPDNARFRSSRVASRHRSQPRLSRPLLPNP